MQLAVGALTAKANSLSAARRLATCRWSFLALRARRTQTIGIVLSTLDLCFRSASRVTSRHWLLLALRAGRTQMAGVGLRRKEAIASPMLIEMGEIPQMLSIVKLVITLKVLVPISLDRILLLLRAND